MEDEEMFTLCVWLLSVCKLYELDVIGGYLNIKIKKEVELHPGTIYKVTATYCLTV